MTTPYPSIKIIFVHKHYYLTPLSFYSITHIPPMKPTVCNVYAIFHSFIYYNDIISTTIYYAHNYYLAHYYLITLIILLRV